MMRKEQELVVVPNFSEVNGWMTELKKLGVEANKQDMLSAVGEICLEMWEQDLLDNDEYMTIMATINHIKHNDDWSQVIA